MSIELTPSYPPFIDPALTLDEVMKVWPETICVFIRHRMHCVGCPVRRFYTVKDACRIYGITESRFVADLHLAVIRARARRSTGPENGASSP